MHSTGISKCRAPLPFTLVAEGGQWAVVDKPPFLLVHPKKPGGPRTLWDGLRELFAFELANGGQVSLVNRLDRETSGLILVAKCATAARRFHTAMTARAIAKEYLALVWGWPEADEFTVAAPILRQGERGATAIYLKRCVHPEGAEALTRFRVERRFEKETSAGNRFALVRAFPATGRTHQIRIHLAHAGHPIVGDKIYGPDERCYLEFIETGWTPSLERRLLLPRHALHSARLRLETPEDGVLDFRSPLAPDLEAWLGGA
jgi:23S rRNA pseudouridine1911/1915/1917 synthase